MDFNDNKPIYLQLAEQIMDEVMRSESVSEYRLPSVREYASKSGVNPNTVNRAYTWLQDQEIIYNKRGIGYFVGQDAAKKILQMRQAHFMQIEMPYFVKKWVELGISPSHFEKLYNKFKKD